MLILIAVAAISIVIVILARRYVLHNQIRIGFRTEFLTRPDGYESLSQHYGFKFRPEPKQMNPSAIYKALTDGSVDVINGFATDGYIPVYDLAALEDDKSCFPPQRAAPIVRSETLEKHPEIGEIPNRLEGRIANETMRNLNYEVEYKGHTPVDAARQSLVSEGLIPPDARQGDGSAGNVNIGSKGTTEQHILGEIMAILIEYSSDIQVVRMFNLGDTMTCFNALKAGDIDLYAEYTGIGMMDILRQEIILDSDKLYKIVKGAFGSKYGIIWLKLFGFSNTHILIMRRDNAEELGIATISDLARYVGWRRGGAAPLAGQF